MADGATRAIPLPSDCQAITELASFIWTLQRATDNHPAAHQLPRGPGVLKQARNTISRYEVYDLSCRSSAAGAQLIEHFSHTIGMEPLQTKKAEKKAQGRRQKLAPPAVSSVQLWRQTHLAADTHVSTQRGLLVCRVSQVKGGKEIVR